MRSIGIKFQLHGPQSTSSCYGPTMNSTCTAVISRVCFGDCLPVSPCRPGKPLGCWVGCFFLQKKKKKLGITALEMLAIHCMTWPRGNKNYDDEYCQMNKIKPLLHEVVQSRQGLKLW